MLSTAFTEWKRQLTSQLRKYSTRPIRRPRRPNSRVASAIEKLENRALLSSITGVVFADANANRFQEVGEAGLADVRVYLDANNSGSLDPGETSVLSASDGGYRFENLPADDYVVRQVVPDGSRQTTPAGGGRLFGTTFLGPVSALELNPETGVILNSFVLPAPPTGASASFTQGLAFDGQSLFYYENTAKFLYRLDPDNGTVLESFDFRNTFANRNIGGLAWLSGRVYMLDVTSNASRALIAFDPTAGGKITATLNLGTAFNFGGGLAALPDENLIVAANATTLVFLDPATGVIQDRALFSGPGFAPTGLAAIGDEIFVTFGGTTTQVLNRDGQLLRTLNNPGESAALDGGANGDGAHHVTLDGIQSVTGRNFGNQSTQGRIRGIKFEDVNGNGIQDSGEGGLAGVTVYLDQNRNGRLDAEDVATTTSADGSYEFAGLAAGAYTVREVVPTGYLQTTTGNDPGTFYGAATTLDGTARMNYVEIDGLTGEVTRIGNPFTDAFHGLVRTNIGEIYALNGNNSDRIFRVDPTTGIFTLVGNTGYEMTFGLAYDPVTDTIYGIGKPSSGDTLNYLLKVNRNNGSVTQIGNGIAGLTATTGLAFDPATRRVVAFDDLDDEFVAVELDGTATRIGVSSGMFTRGVAYSPFGLTFGGRGTGTDGQGNPLRQTLRTVNFATGNRTTALVLSEAAELESLDWANDPSQYRLLLGTGEIRTGVNFGNQRLNRPPVPHAGGPYVTNEGSGITLNAGLSSDPDNDPLSFAWDLDNDGTFDDAMTVTVNLTWQDLVALGIDDEGRFPVSVRVSDGELSDTKTQILDVHSVLPSNIVLNVNSAVVDENGSVSLTGSFSNPGTEDSHSVVIQWGDGTSTDLALPKGQRTFNASHQYLDDNAADLFTITATVTDDDADSGTQTLDVGVRNSPPAITSLSISAGRVGDTRTNQIVSLTATFLDQGTLDTHSAVVDWGDGTLPTGGIIEGGRVQASHTYAEGGVYHVRVTLTDDDGGLDSASTFAYVTGISIRGGVLQVVGTAQDDNITITSHKKQGSIIKAGFLSGSGTPINPNSFQSIEVFLGDGDDRISVSESYSQSLLVLGGTGADTITGAAGRSLIIGGLGADQLKGGSNQDILIAGTTAFDDDLLALRAILAEWNSNRTLQQRVGNLFDGSGSATRLNGSHFLTVGNGGTIQDDFIQDQIQSSGNTDWLFYTLNADRIRGKIRDDIFANDLDGLLNG